MIIVLCFLSHLNIINLTQFCQTHISLKHGDIPECVSIRGISGTCNQVTMWYQYLLCTEEPGNKPQRLKRANASAPPLFNLLENFKAKDMKPCTLYFFYYNVHMLNKVVVSISLKRRNVEALILNMFSYIYIPDTCNC